MNVTIREFTRLRKGMRIRLEEGDYRVIMVNSCRALCAPLTKTREVVITGRCGDPDKKFLARQTNISISPNSECEIIRE